MSKAKRDMLGNEIRVGDRIVCGPGGAYVGVYIGSVVRETPKKIGIQFETRGRLGGDLQALQSRDYLTLPEKVIVLSRGVSGEDS